MDGLAGASQVELNLSRTHLDTERNVRALASGLRVVSASDDPSGLAIASTIQTKVSGLQQGVQNVQTANNLLNVADASLAGVERILTRVHDLIVEAASDLNSDSQLQSIQTEIDQLMHEINRVAGDAKFNGLQLFSGAYDGTPGLQTNPQAVQINPALNPDGSVPQANVYAQVNPGTPNAGPLMYNPVYGNVNFVPGMIQVQITGYSNNPVDPVFGALGQPGVYVKVTEYSTSAGFGGTNGATEQVYTQAIPTDTGPDAGSGSPVFLQTADGTANMLKFDLANLSQQDVGTAMAFETYDATNPSGTPTGHALEVNSEGVEGGTVAVNLPSVNVTTLGISGITVLRPQTVDAFNNATGEDASNETAVQDSEARVTNAIDMLGQLQAHVGAQSVSLQEDANNSSLEVVNQIASESAIRDTDVAQAASSFTKDQVLSQVGLSVLSQMQVNAHLVTQLVSRSALRSF